MEWSRTEEEDETPAPNYKKKKKTGDLHHVKRYWDLKHQVQKRQRQAYWEHVGSIVTPQDQENAYAGMKKEQQCWCLLWCLLQLYSHPTNKTDILNRHFQSVFSNSANVSKEAFSKSYPMPTTENQFPVIEDIDNTLNGIVKLLKYLNPTKSPGPDNLSPKVLKELANEVGPLLLLI